MSEPGSTADGDLAALVAASRPSSSTQRDELNRLDGVAGDGDLGLTVATASRALIELAPALAALPEAEAIRKCGTEIARRRRRPAAR